MAQASAVKAGRGFFGGALGETLAGVLGVLLAGTLFFAFFVQPRAQHERDRIYRAMAQVARLIDDQVEVAGAAATIWRSHGDDATNAKDAQGRNEALEDYPHLGFNCPDGPVLCVESLRKPNAAHDTSDVDRPGIVHLPLKTIAENADLPYPEAILLIMDEKGNVLAGQDRDGRWDLFHSLGILILKADSSRDKAAEQSSKPDGRSGGEASKTRELAEMKQTIEAYQRGERNVVFSGAPARLTHSFGGQDYAVFMVAHRLSAVDGAVWIGGDDSPIASGSQGAEQGETGPARSRGLIYAFLVPERVIDRTATALPKSALVHLLMAIVVLFLAIPLIKLFSQSALKPIRRADLAGVMLSIMLITMTATLFTTVVLFRSSVTRDIEGELAWLSNQVSQSLSKAIAAAHTGEAAEKAVLFGTHQGVVAQQDADALVGVTAVNDAGTCLPALGQADANENALCGGGFFGKQPLRSRLNVAKRPYFVASQMGLGFPTGSYVQFLRSKGNGRLSLSAMGPEVSCSGDDCSKGNKDGRQLFTFFPVALRAPVLPPNFAFMVVLNSDLPEELGARGGQVEGDVLYHSHQARSMNENLLVEAGYDPGLASALEMLRQGTRPAQDEVAEVRSSLLSISYQGHPHFALVRPVPDTPWSIVAIYARDEALDLLGASVVQAFLLGCGWIALVFAVCWGLPRILRVLFPRPASGLDGQAPPPIRGRSIWFFPNALCVGAGDGLRYSFVTGARELIWQGGVLLLQGAALWACAPEVAVLANFGLAVVLLIGNYLTIVRRSADTDEERGRRHAVRVAWLRKGTAGVTLLAMVFVLGFYGKVDGSDRAQTSLFLLAAGGVVVLQLGRWLALGRDPDNPPCAPLPPLYSARQRRAYILRTLTLLTIVVSMPMVCIMALTYSVNLERYMGRSLAHVAAQSEWQALEFQDDARRLAHARGGNEAATRDEILDQWGRAFGFGTDVSRNPGWLVSPLPVAKRTPAPAPAPDTETDGGGLFGVGVKSRCGGSEEEGDNSAHEDCDVTSHQAQGWLAALVERLQPRVGVPDPVVAGQANGYVLVREAGRLALALPGQFQPLRAQRADWSLEGKALVSSDSTQLPLHPDWWTRVFLGGFVALFGFALYRLLVAVAEHLTGLYLLPVEVAPEQLKARRAQMASHLRMAWDALGGYPQKARLLSLAYGRTINFHERASIRDLVERGYLQLTPYVRIASEELAEFIRHDLPREERARVRAYCAQVDDKWDHVRLPIIVAYVAACMLVAYVSPNLVQLVATSFFALAALLPLMRDPLAQFLGKKG
ncbi:MAG: hypothetical protein VYD90_09185 [Pseudomonadota bacterium]|nr:hypothetical protein [Pseudomonadota bacterium]